MSSATLLLRLEGPLQAWSLQSRFGIRDTEREPTKSGVLGMLCAALGVDRQNQERLSQLAKLSMAVRVDQPGTLLRDYQTAGGGTFRGSDKYVLQNTCVPSVRFFLQGASFLVALEGEISQVEACAVAVQDPHWPMVLGRKKCLMSVAPFVGVTSSRRLEALQHVALPPGTLERTVRVQDEVAFEDGLPRADVPRSFAQGERSYAVRYVQNLWMHIPLSPT